jgi:integrase
MPSRPVLDRIAPDSFAAVIRAYMSSAKFQNYAPNTRIMWGRELALAELPPLGALPVAMVRPSLIQAFLDGYSGRPGKQMAALTALKQLERWAIVRDLLPSPITLGVEVERSDGGHVPWSDEHVALAEECARPELAMAITLGANTGQRGSDLVKMRWTDIEVYRGRPGINVVQVKTGRQLWVPMTQALQDAMTAWERSPGFILRRATGHPWTRADLSKAWERERQNNESLANLRAAGLVMHGLRATACVRLSRSGASTRQIADMVGMSEDMVGRYCRLSSQRENASAAIVHLEGTPREHVTNKWRKSKE